MVMRAMRAGTSGGFFKYILFGLLGMSVGGLVVMDVRGVLGGGGVDGNDVVRIENDTISIQDFNRTLQRSLSQYGGVTPQQAFKIGLTEELLTGEIRSYYLLNEARNMGIELDQNRIAMRVAEMLKPNARSGQSLQDILDDVLRNQRMSEAEFISVVKREASGQLIMQALRRGFKPDTTVLANALYESQRQTRNIEFILFPDSEADNVEPATEDQLKHLYETLKNTKYKKPEFRTAKMAVFDPAAIEIDVTVSEKETKEYYEDNIDKFAVPEQFILTQSFMDDPAQAQKIYDAVQSGKSLKDAALEILGTEGKYFEKKPFDKKSMLPELLDAIAKIEVGGVTEPVKTMLGYHIVLLDDILPESSIPFEEVEKTIIDVITNEKTDERIYGISEELDEKLDEGLSLEDIAKTIKLQITTIDPVNNKGFGKNVERIMDQFKVEDQKPVLDLIYELKKGQSSLLQELPSGQIAAFLLSEIEREHFSPFEEVKEELAKQFITDQRRAENGLSVKKHVAEIGTGGSTFESIARDNKKEIKKIEGISLSGEIPAPLIDQVRSNIFQTNIGDYDVLALDGQFALIRVSGFEISKPKDEDEAKKEIYSIKQTVDREAGDEMFLMYIRKIGKKYPVKVNRRLLEYAYGEKDDDS